MKDFLNLYETWNTPEKAKKWRAKISQTEVVNELHNNAKMAQFSLAKPM
jgi:hypothetical protein